MEDTKKQSTPVEKGTANVHLTVKDLASEDRPREKFIERGKKALTDAELIALLIGSGSPEESAVTLSQRILNRCGNSLSSLSRQSLKDLTSTFKGVGEAKAITILAALELGYRLLREDLDQEGHYLRQSTDCFNYIGPQILDLPIEEFWAIYLNNKNKVLFKQCISAGSINETPVDPRKIFSTALEKNAISIVVAHNHPSGDLTPSRMDKDLTYKLIEAGKLLKIQVIEHLIVGIDKKGHPDYYSFHDNGLM